jgi:methionyl-tRNA synthetase
MRRFYITTAIPYVNGDPHLGHALELVQADVLARHRRLRGERVRFLSGTDDNALKNVDAALAVGTPVAEFVARSGERFADLAEPLQVSLDDFIRTGSDPRHRPGVERLWRACAEAGDLYQREYEGLYCPGCEAFVSPSELIDGRCPEHAQLPERIAERNWFFRLSRHADRLLDLIRSGHLAIQPEHRRNEVLAFIEGGLADISVSRARARAHGWGIPVPGDAQQVVYVWFDALANYVTALGFGDDAEEYREWWGGDGERVHVIGKGITRFHAVYWPAILLSAGQPLPTRIVVHDYLTVEGRKIAKSLGTAVDPLAAAQRFGSDSLRWWFVRDVPRNGDADFRDELVAARANELADDLGNLISRVVALAGRNAVEGAADVGPFARHAQVLRRRCEGLPGAIDRALDAFDLRLASSELWAVVAEANRFLSSTRPWEIARDGRAGDPAAAHTLAAVLTVALDACGVLARELTPFLPDAAERIREALAELDAQRARTLFPKFEEVAEA